ncbi:MAG: hypothetical protein Q8K86_07325 [Candidatus Nanopelagicaceae bacterium]|nr:hypothetical protein [Candidatus Nanopelagicaceae bacterium]
MSEVSDAIDTIIAVQSLSTGRSEAEIGYEFMRDLHEWLKNGFDEEDLEAFDKMMPKEEKEEFFKRFNRSRENYVTDPEFTKLIDRDLFILGTSVGLL